MYVHAVTCGFDAQARPRRRRRWRQDTIDNYYAFHTGWRVLFVCAMCVCWRLIHPELCTLSRAGAMWSDRHCFAGALLLPRIHSATRAQCFDLELFCLINARVRKPKHIKPPTDMNTSEIKATSWAVVAPFVWFHSRLHISIKARLTRRAGGGGGVGCSFRALTTIHVGRSLGFKSIPVAACWRTHSHIIAIVGMLIRNQITMPWPWLRSHIRARVRTYTSYFRNLVTKLQSSGERRTLFRMNAAQKCVRVRTYWCMCAHGRDISWDDRTVARAFTMLRLNRVVLALLW